MQTYLEAARDSRFCKVVVPYLGVEQVRVSVNWLNQNGRLPFKLCHSSSAGKLNDQPNSSPVRFRKPSPPPWLILRCKT